jgi:aminopeptidase
MTYAPPQPLLQHYADLLVNFALGGGEGIKPGETVWVAGAEDAKPLFFEVCRAVWRSGGNVIQEYLPADDSQFNFRLAFLEEAQDAQLDFFPAAYARGRIDDADHLVYIDADRNPKALAGADSEKLMRRQAAHMPDARWRTAKEDEGRFTWVIALYGTEAMAAEAGLTLEQYWAQIVKACFLEDADTVGRWREVERRLADFTGWLNSLPIERLHVTGADADLWLTIGQQRRWLAGGGRNIPSFEVFTSPDWRGTEGWIRFSEPLYVFGSLVRDVEVHFTEGLVTEVHASENEQLLRDMVGAKNGDRVGEFSLTDARLSPIDHFMATTLFDENMGGPYGNTHVALGMSLTPCYDGDASAVSDDEWEALGFNVDAAIHTDIVSTVDRTVTAVLADGSEQIIYAGGHFQMAEAS